MFETWGSGQRLPTGSERECNQSPVTRDMPSVARSAGVPSRWQFTPAPVLVTVTWCLSVRCPRVQYAPSCRVNDPVAVTRPIIIREILYESVSNTRDAVQLSLVQLDNYGPWTVTPSPRRETDLQALQARLYATLADFVGGHDGYAFLDRIDNMIAVTDGMTVADHERLQERIRNQYPVTISIGVGVGETPTAALETASRVLQAEGSAQDAERTARLATAGPVGETSGSLTVAHFDVIDVTGEFTDQKGAGETSLAIQRATVSLASYLREEHEGMARFVGGDNIIALCPSLEEEAFEAATAHVQATTGIPLQVGVGEGETPHEAGYRAKLALEECRETGRRIDRFGPQATIDR